MNSVWINGHLDYVAAPLIQTTLRIVLSDLHLMEKQIEEEVPGLIATAKKNSYYAPGIKNHLDVPILLPDLRTPYILEVMTASTSGSNTEDKTDR